MMAKLQRAAAMAVFALGATTASAVDNVWNGGYGGFNAGQASSHSCTTWAPTGSSAESTTLAGLYQPDCATHGAFVGGGQIGDNFQTDRLAWGVEAAVDVLGRQQLHPVRQIRSELGAGRRSARGHVFFLGATES